MTESALVQKIWNLAGVLRDDGVSYDNYLEQLTYLLFLKMAHEHNRLISMVGSEMGEPLDFPRLKDSDGIELPDAETADWEHLRPKTGTDLETFYN